ncbi:MAG: hypothetical protein ABIG87_00210 [Patescibacteria group bacterium]
MYNCNKYMIVRIIKKLFFSIIFFFFLFSINVAMAESVDVGFAGNFWYSQNKFFDGDCARVYIAVQNYSSFDITGNIQFFDNDKLLNKTSFSVVNGRLIESWADWNIKKGEHQISAKISDVKKMVIGKNPIVAELINNGVILSEKWKIDIDTDKDGLGNEEDEDDDGDGVSDMEEKENRTDPLVFDMPTQSSGEKVAEQSEQSEETVGATDTKIETAKIVLADTARITTEVVENVLDVSQNLAEKAKVFLQEKKEKIDEELAIAKKEEDQTGEKLNIEKEEGLNFYTASIIGAMPNLKEAYRFLLATLIYILNSWWILTGTIFVLLWLLWKILKSKLNFRRFNGINS